MDGVRISHFVGLPDSRRRRLARSFPRAISIVDDILRRGFLMTETRGRVFDEIGRLMTDAAGAASGVRREVETLVRQQASRILADLDLVRRDEFEAVRAMAERAREENERLAERLAALEAATGARRDEAMGEPTPGPEESVGGING